MDFLAQTDKWPGDIITNPPYKYRLDFIKHGLSVIDDGQRVALFLKVQFLEGKQRRKFFEENPPKVIYVSSSRLRCAMNGEFEKYAKSNRVSYRWFIWEKGFKGEPVIRWFN